MTAHATTASPAASLIPPPPLRGVFTAITTPFTHDTSSIDFARVDDIVRTQAAAGVAGIVVAGTTGESPTLSHAEWTTLVSKAVELARPHRLAVVAGTGSNSTAHAVELHKQAHALGAHASLSVNPYYNKPTQEGLYSHFRAQADSAPLPIILYNIPGRTGVALAPATVRRLADHPHIRAVKEATGSTDSASEIAQLCPNLSLLSGDDTMTLPFASVGAVGVVSVLSNVFPAELVSMCNHAAANRWSDALEIHRRLFRFTRALFAETNPIPVKAALKLLGRDNGSLRLPMTPASPATVELLRACLRELEAPSLSSLA